MKGLIKAAVGSFKGGGGKAQEEKKGQGRFPEVSGVYETVAGASPTQADACESQATPTGSAVPHALQNSFSQTLEVLKGSV